MRVLGDEIGMGDNRKKSIGRLSITVAPQLISYVSPAHMLIVAGTEPESLHYRKLLLLLKFALFIPVGCN